MPNSKQSGSSGTTPYATRWRRETAAAPFHFSLALLLAAAVFLPASPCRMLLLGLLSGLSPLLAVRKRWGLSEFVLVSPQASLVLWSLLAIPALKLGAFAAVPAVVAAVLGERARRDRRTLTLEFGVSDAAGFLTFCAMLIPVLTVFAANGMQGGHFFARGWFARDSFYLFALAQESLERGGWPAENPFVAGVANFYPSLLHVTLGALAAQSGLPAAQAILILSPLALATSLPLLVVAACRAADLRSGIWTVLLALIGAAGLFFLRPDLFIYPQTQAYLLGWLALVLWLWGESETSGLEAAIALAMSFLVVLAHTVTGAACIVFVTSRAFEGLRAPETRRRSLLQIGAAAVLGLLFLRLNSLPFSSPHHQISLTDLGGVTDFIAPWWAAVAATIAMAIAYRRRTYRSLGIVAMSALGIVYYVLGSSSDGVEQFFIYYNAERFLHLALFIALPLAAGEAGSAGLIATTCVAAGALLQPTSLAILSYRLCNDTPVIVDAQKMAVLTRIREETPPTARILNNLRSFEVPAFTGRSQNPTEINVWGLNTLPPAEFDRHLSDVARFSQLSLKPDQRVMLLDRWGYTHLLLRKKTLPDNLKAWTERQFPPGSMRVLFVEGNYLLLERVPPSSSSSVPVTIRRK
ncbi:MAG: hypothetical protein H7Z41_08350 [Cytophagales bacterium]|nr:hypothetical protein [Armatimonadota bacterium]